MSYRSSKETGTGYRDGVEEETMRSVRMREQGRGRDKNHGSSFAWKGEVTGMWGGYMQFFGRFGGYRLSSDLLLLLLLFLSFSFSFSFLCLFCGDQDRWGSSDKRDSDKMGDGTCIS